MFLEVSIMFSRLFKKKEAQRQLSHPKDLQLNDMVQLQDSFILPQELKGQTLKVVDINTYQYQYSTETEFVLRGESRTPIFLVVENEDGEEWANFSVKIERGDVEHLFSLEQFADIFDSEDMTELARNEEIDASLQQWTSEHYSQEGEPSVGYFHEKDYRDKELSNYEEDGGEPLESISLSDDDGKFFINIEIWENGDTDVSLTVCRPLSDIVELYPATV